MRHVVMLAVIVLIAAGCAAGPEPAPPRASVAVGGPAGTSGPPLTERPTGLATGVATSSPATDEPPTDPPATNAPPTDQVPGRPDPATFLQVCREPDGAGPDPIPCADAVETALSAPNLAGARVTRVDVRPTCEPRVCPPKGAVPLAVTVLSDRPPMEIDVVRGPDGGLALGTVRRGQAPTTPAFAPPPPGLAALPGAPASLGARQAYPLCGEETAPMGGPYDGVARRCFLNGVLAGSPVEFATSTSGTEGGALTMLIRFAGAGGVEYLTGEDAQWTRAFAGIRPAAGGLVFDADGMATRREPVP